MNEAGVNCYRTRWGHLGAYHKAGCQSIQQACKQFRIPEVAPADVRGGPVVIFFRDPLERLVSAWRYFVAKGKFPGGVPKGCPYEDFVDGVLDSGWRDVHWWPVAQRHRELFEGRGKLIYLPFDHLADVWPELMPMPLPHLNASRPADVNRLHRYDDLRRYFADDNEAYAVATGNWQNLSDTLATVKGSDR